MFHFFVFHFHFQIDCDVQNCTFRDINGTGTTSMTVKCRGAGCDGSRITCPDGDGSSCAVDCSQGTCNSIAIRNTARRPMKSFAMYCPLESGCANSVIDLNPISIGNVTIVWGSDRVCHTLLLSFLYFRTFGFSEFRIYQNANELWTDFMVQSRFL